MLLLIKTRVATALLEQAIVIASFNNLSPFKDQNLIRAQDRRQSVRNYKRGSVTAKGIERLLNERFAFAVEAGCGFIEQENRRLSQQCASNSNPLALSAGEFIAALANNSERSSTLTP
jgi:hypothetical protein